MPQMEDPNFLRATRELSEAIHQKQRMTDDPWIHRSEGMRCTTCMWFVEKQRVTPQVLDAPRIGRCRRHAPTMSGYPVVFSNDWCGDHKLDENK